MQVEGSCSDCADMGPEPRRFFEQLWLCAEVVFLSWTGFGTSVVLLQAKDVRTGRFEQALFRAILGFSLLRILSSYL